jgi:hypothetical protein
MTCTAFVSYSPFSRTRASQDLVVRATRLGAERVEVCAETAVQTRGALLQFWEMLLLTKRRVRYAGIQLHP